MTWQHLLILLTLIVTNTLGDETQTFVNVTSTDRNIVYNTKVNISHDKTLEVTTEIGYPLHLLLIYQGLMKA